MSHAKSLIALFSCIALLAPSAQSSPQCPEGGYDPPPPPVPSPPPIYGGPGDTTPGATTGGSPAPTASPARSGGLGVPPLIRPLSGGGAKTQASSTGCGLPGGSQDWEVWWQFNRERFFGTGERFPSLPRTGDAAPSFVEPPSQRQIDEAVLPRLVQLLASDPGDELLNATLAALARIGGRLEDSLGRSSLAELTLPYLSHPHRSIRENAVICLGVLAEPSSSPVLVEILNDAPAARERCGQGELSSRLRAFAAYGLGLTAHRTQNSDVRKYVQTHLYRALALDDPDIQVAAVLSLGVAPSSTPAEKISRGLIELFGKKNALQPLARAHVPTTLAKMHAQASPAVRDRIVAALVGVLSGNKERNEVRQSAALALGAIGGLGNEEQNELIRDTLLDCATDGDLMARHFALLSLAEVAGRDGVDESEEIHAFLLARLAKLKAQSRPWAALAVGVLGRNLAAHRRSLSADEKLALRSAFLASKATPLVSALSLSLGLAGASESAELLARRLGDSASPEVRLQGAVGLGLIADARGRAALQGLLPEAQHDPFLLEETARALAQLEDPELVPMLAKQLEECDCSLSKTSLARGLGRSKDARALEPLIAMLDEEGPELEQAWAVQAIGQLCDRDERPWVSVFSTGINYLASPPSLTDPTGSGILDYL